MPRQPFTFHDIAAECRIETGCHSLDGQRLGMKIHVPAALYSRHPFSASAYDFLQFLRPQILEHGTVEFPHLPLNRSNYTLAQRAPWEHAGNPNPYMTDECQSPHQDTPPYPTAFWLGETRRFFATWVMSLQGLRAWGEHCRQQPQAGIASRHRELVPASLANGTGLLLNRNPGLLLIDNSNHRKLYHARTCLFDKLTADTRHEHDAPMYAFNEIGLLEYIDSLDIYRGAQDRNQEEREAVRAFMATEPGKYLR